MKFLSVAAERDETAAREFRRRLFVSCRELLADIGGELAGYAIVAWSPDGALRSVYEIHGGPIGAPLVPTLVSDALNRHGACAWGFGLLRHRDIIEAWTGKIKTSRGCALCLCPS